MTHELKHIIEKAIQNQQSQLKSVLATVVHLDGSSYRKPGVRMLISERGVMTGAVSGGCVEKEILRRASSVFETGQAKVMTYDGRYRLGCEGILYILIEPFFVSEELAQAFDQHLSTRDSLALDCYYKREDDASGNFGSVLRLAQQSFTFAANFSPNIAAGDDTFHQQLAPTFQLLLIGGEHDAVKLCQMASLLGWEVTVITGITDPKTTADFPGAKEVTAESPDMFSPQNIDTQTAVVLMTHNYAKDLQYLLKLQAYKPGYIGILGSAKRRDQLQNEIFEYSELMPEFLERIHSPAGLNLGAETPEEIALSILSEILSTTREKAPFPLKDITGRIHS